MADSDLDPRKGKRTIERPFLWLVRTKDPTYDKDKRQEVEYEFGGGRRVFTANPTKRGAYSDS